MAIWISGLTDKNVELLQKSFKFEAIACQIIRKTYPKRVVVKANIENQKQFLDAKQYVRVVLGPDVADRLDQMFMGLY